MKKLLLLSAYVIITVLFFSCSKEKESSVVINDENPSPILEEVITLHLEGHLFIYVNGVWYYGGTYKRQFFQNLGDCYQAESNCMPTVEINAPAPPPVYYADLEPVANSVNDDYGDGLETAVDSGHQYIKDWYFNGGGDSYLNYSSQIENDLQNDDVTFKLFGDNYFLVNYYATTYDDCPDYW